MLAHAPEAPRLTQASDHTLSVVQSSSIWEDTPANSSFMHQTLGHGPDLPRNRADSKGYMVPSRRRSIADEEAGHLPPGEHLVM